MTTPAPRSLPSTPTGGLTLARRFSLIVLCAVAPTLLLMVWTARARLREDVARARADAVHLLEDASADQQRAIDQTALLLQTLAEVPEVRLGDDSACAHALRRVHLSRRELNAISRTDSLGWLTCSSPALAQRKDVSSRPGFQRARRSGRLAIGDYQTSDLTQRPVVALALPVADSAGRLSHVLAASIRLDALTAMAARRRLPPTGELRILDSAGVVLAHVPRRPDMIGRPDPDSTVRSVRALHGTLTFEGEDARSGEPRLYALRAIGARGSAPAWMAYSVSLDAISAPALGALRHQLLLLAAATVLALALARLAARRLVLDRVAAIGAAVQRLAAGDLTARASAGPGGGELGELAAAFDDMATAIDRRQREFVALAESSPDFVVRVDAAGRLAYANAGVGRLFGTDAASLVGRQVEALDLQPGARALWDEDARRTLRDGGTRSATCTLEVDGDERVFDVRLVAERADGAGVSHVLIVARDDTARARAEERLRQSQRLDSIGLLAGGIAHDFGNMLGAIMNSAQTARLVLPPGHEALEDVDNIIGATERASTLVSQLLAFARRQRITPTPVALADIASGVEGMLVRLLGARVALRVSHAPAGLVVADPTAIEQVLVNLVVNARDAMPEGGTLEISTREQTVPEGDASATGRFAVLRVRDTGHGMPTSVQTRVFEPFFTTKENGRGTGLGLARCYGIVRQHGGHITVDSRMGAGTTVEVWLPIVAGCEVSAPQVAPQVAPRDAQRPAPVRPSARV